MNLKPFRNYSEYEVVPYFALTTETGGKGTVVKLYGSGFVNGRINGIARNDNFGIANVYSPLWENKNKVAPTAASGDKPYGVTLYDVVNANQFGFATRWDQQYCDEHQCVPSGVSVPICRRGDFLVGPFSTGQDVGIGSGLVPAANGDVTVVGNTTSTNNLGQFIGGKDNDGYALFSLELV